MDWDELASLDPMWAVLSEPDKRGNQWNSDAFFHTGKGEIDRLMSKLARLTQARRKALDFGCGLGRLTRALLAYYGEAHGVDISANMVNQAKLLAPSCSFHVNESDDLSLFPDKTFDLVYSNRVLQHLPSSAMIANFIREFFRITVPGGLVVFQVPCKKSYRNIFNVKRSAFRFLRAVGVRPDTVYSRLKLHPMRMTALPKRDVRAVVRESSGELLDESLDESAHFAVLYCCRRVD